MSRTSTISIGENRGKPRIWIEGKYLGDNGFAKGQQVRTTWIDGMVKIEAVDEDGDHTVAERRGRQILDFNCAAISEVFNNAEKVTVTTSAGHIIITASRSEAKRIKRTNVNNKTAGSIFSGGGLLDQAAIQAGFTTTFGVEWNQDYADIWQANHTGHLYQGCISEVLLSGLPQVELFTGGIPCEPFSRVRRQTGNKRRETGYADHELADMTFWALQVIDACNPRTIVLEEVEDYVNSELGIIAVKVLERMGYTVESRVINGLDYGALCMRKRCVIVAVSDGQINWPQAVEHNRTMAEVLHDVDDARCEWWNESSKPWWFKWRRDQEAKGNNFANTADCEGKFVTPESGYVHAITKRYFNGQGGNPVVVHPTLADTYRWLTLDEVRAIHGLPQDYHLGETKTIAGEVIGQGVLVDVFQQIIESVSQTKSAAKAA